MAEPLSISRGPNRGEAAFLGESSFDPIRFTENLVRQEQQNRLQRKKEGEQELKALLTDDFKAKWDIDKLKYFDPKIKAFREEVISAFRENKGRLTPEQRILLENQKKAIQEEVLLSNTVQESYIDQAKLLDADKAGAYDQDKSRENLKIFADPTSNPETAKELMDVYGGDVFRWRADNAMKYGLVPSFSFDAFVDKTIKSENVSDMPIRDNDGNVVSEKLPSGQYLIQSERRLTDEQANSLAQRTWNENNASAQKAKDFALQMVDASYTIDDSGNLSFVVGQTVPPEDNEKIMQYLGGEKALAGLSKEEARNKLGKAYLAMTMERKSDKGIITKLTSKDPSFMYRRSSGGGGGGGDWQLGDPIKTVKKISYEEGTKDPSGNYTGDVTTTDREVTTELYLSLKPAKTTMGASSLTRNTANGKQVSNTKVKDIEYGDMAIVAVNKATGQIMADEFLKDPKIKKNIKYTIVSFGNGKEDRPFGQPLNVSVYTPTEEVLNALMNAGGAKYAEKVKSKYDFMKAEADKLNKSLNKPATRTGAGNQQQQGKRVTWTPGMPLPKNK